MRIIIIGDGKVGYKLAKQLSAEKYDIVMIDSNENKLRFAMDRLDIACVTGDGADAEVLKQADVAHADLVIACTSADECNMLSCLIARKLGARHTIARVRNPIYYRQIGLLKEDLHLSMAVNPELIVADEISRLLLFPDASQVETFVKGRVELIELPVAEGSSLAGLSLAEMYNRFQIRLLVCAVERGEDVRIPDGEYVLKAGDRLHIAASHKDLERFFKANGKRKEKIKKEHMEKNVIMLGKKSNPYPYICRCDLYVQPSRYEGKCVSVKEAQMLGKPVVITNYETAKSQLEDGVDGIIVSMDNEKCAEQIEQVLKDDEKMKRISQKCMEKDYSNATEIEKICSMCTY